VITSSEADTLARREGIPPLKMPSKANCVAGLAAAANASTREGIKELLDARQAESLSDGNLRALEKLSLYHAPAAPPSPTPAATGASGASGAIETLASMTPLDMLTGLGAAIVVLGVPAVVLAVIKLHRRDSSPLLEGCGWAVNGRMRLTRRQCRYFTQDPRIPRGAKRVRGRS
jgi:hypothetical protein